MTTISAAGRNPTTPRMKSRLHQLRAARGYGLAVRVLGSTWFLTLALLTTQRTYSYAEALKIGDTSPAGWSALLAALCLTVFYLALCWLIILRPSPTACDDYVLPSFIAFVGTYLPWTIVFFAPIGASDSQNLASAALLLIGSVLMAFAIFHLGRCFSIVPQARTLVRAGPYKLVGIRSILPKKSPSWALCCNSIPPQRLRYSYFTVRCRFAGYSMRRTSCV